MDLGSVGLGVLGGLLAWIAANFFGSPIRNFFTLRTEIRHEMMRLENVSPPKPHWTYPQYSKEDLERMTRDSKQAQATLRSLGTRLKALGETEPAVRAVRLLGFDPMGAALGLIGLSNVFLEHGKDRFQFREQVRKALKLPL